MEQTHTTERRTLLRQSLAIVRTYQDTWDTLEAANKAHPLPAPLGRAFTLEELEAYEAALAQRTHALTPLEAAWKETDRATQHHIGTLLRAGMPPERWIRDGEWVIGMSYSNGGGHSYDLHCLPAQTQPLPSLNRRYTGDEQRGASNDTHGKDKAMEDTLAYWHDQIRRGATVDMIPHILADWREEREERRAGGLVCRAPRGGGHVCGQLAIQVDVQRGIMVCAEHAPDEL